MTDTSWTLHTMDGALTFPGALGSSLPSITSGNDLTLTLFTDTIDDPDFTELREYARYSNDSTTTTGTDIRGRPWYHEAKHPSADFSSVLVRLEPGADVGSVTNWWAVITGGEIQTTPMGTGPRIALELFVLCESGDYQGRADVRETFEAGL